MQFYVPDLNAKTLSPEESTHLFVMRVQEGKTYKATDLKGRISNIRITLVNKKSKSIEFEQAGIPKLQPSSNQILFQAIPEKTYLDKLIEVLPMSGVSTLYLFYADYSTQYTINQERLTKILIRSCEQTELAYLPKIVILNQKDLEVELKKYIPVVLDCGCGDDSNSAGNSNKPALVGPEGGWSSKEVDFFQSIKLPFGSLGSTIYPAWIAGLIYQTITNNNVATK